MTDTKPMTEAAIRRLQQERDNFWIALHVISKYLPPERLRAQSEKLYGLPGEEAIEYAYENVLQLACLAIKGRKRPKESSSG